MAILAPKTVAPTSYPKNPNEANIYVPVGQLGNPVSRSAIPVPMTPATGGTNWVNNAYGYSNTPNYSVNPNIIMEATQRAAQPPAPIPLPVPTPTDPRKIQTSPNGYFNANGDWVSMNSPDQEAQYRQQLDEQLNASYNPAYENLNAVEAQYRQEYPTSQQFIEQSYGSVLPELQSEQQTKLQGLESQRTKGKQEEKSQFGKARQLYNELRQGGLTRFGGASSTGEAYGELLGRTTAQQMNEIGQNFGNMYGEIAKEEANVNDFYAKKRTDLEKEKQLRLQELKNQFDQTIREINTKRVGLDSEKAARRLAALQEYSAQARQMQFESAKFQQQLDAWKAAKDEAVTLARQFNAKSFTIPSMPGGFGGFSITGTSGGGGSNTPTGYIDDETLRVLQNQGLNLSGANYVPGRGITSTSFSKKSLEDQIAEQYGIK